MDRENLAIANGYPIEILNQLLLFESSIRGGGLPSDVFKQLYERGAPIYSVGFPLPRLMRFTDFLGCLQTDSLATTWERWEATVAQDGRSANLRGRSTEIWRRQDDGTWKMAYDHASVSIDLALAVQATTDVYGLGGHVVEMDPVE